MEPGTRKHDHGKCTRSDVGSLQTGLRISAGRICLANDGILYSPCTFFWPKGWFPLHPDVEVLFAEVTSVEFAGWARRLFSWTPGRPAFIVRTRDGHSYSFQVRRPVEWVDAIRKEAESAS